MRTKCTAAVLGSPRGVPVQGQTQTDRQSFPETLASGQERGGCAFALSLLPETVHDCFVASRTGRPRAEKAANGFMHAMQLAAENA